MYLTLNSEATLTMFVTLINLSSMITESKHFFNHCLFRKVARQFNKMKKRPKLPSHSDKQLII